MIVKSDFGERFHNFNRTANLIFLLQLIVPLRHTTIDIDGAMNPMTTILNQEDKKTA